MIYLVVEDYCQNCPYFDPVVERICDFYDDKCRTIVKCEDHNKCEIIHNQLEKELADLKGVGGIDSHSC